jgi:hypothetical protein
MNEEAQQLHFRYSPEDDRIMAFIRGEGGQEHVFELTRRVIKALWPQLAARVGAASEAVKKAPTEVRKQVLEFEQEGAMQTARQTGAVSTARSCQRHSSAPATWSKKYSCRTILRATRFFTFRTARRPSTCPSRWNA